MSKTISPAELKDLLESDEFYALIDVRERNEYESRQIFGASQVSRSQLEFRFPVLVPVKETKIVLYDDDHLRASLSAHTLERYGYSNIYILEGGIGAWEDEGFPVVKGVHVLSKSFGEIVGEIHNVVPTILPQELHPLLESNPDDYIIIEVRPSGEVQKTGSIPGAINITGIELPLRITDYINTGKTIITTCAGRTRGFIAAATLKLMGVKNVYDLNNGTLGWRLAGFELEQTIPLGPPPSLESRQAADHFATRLAKEQGIQFVSVEQLEFLQQKSDIEPLYVLDVRSSEEYDYIGHIPGSVSIPGGQAIQNTDDVIAINKANIVFVCDNGTRSIITAHWYKQIGFANVFVLNGGLSSWLQHSKELVQKTKEPSPLGFVELLKKVKKIDAAYLKNILTASPTPVIIDVSDSKTFANGHIPGSNWVAQGRLEQRIGTVVPDKTSLLVLTSNDQYQPVFAAGTLIELGYTNVFALEGGNESWLETGYELVQGLEGITPDDWQIHLTEYGLEEAVKYFEWEESLVHLPEYMSYFQRKNII